MAFRGAINISHQITFSFSYLHISEADSIGHLRPQKKGNKNFLLLQTVLPDFSDISTILDTVYALIDEAQKLLRTEAYIHANIFYNDLSSEGSFFKEDEYTQTFEEGILEIIKNSAWGRAICNELLKISFQDSTKEHSEQNIYAPISKEDKK